MRIPSNWVGSIAIASGSDPAKRGGVIINENVLTTSATRRHIDALSR